MELALHFAATQPEFVEAAIQALHQIVADGDGVAQLGCEVKIHSAAHETTAGRALLGNDFALSCTLQDLSVTAVNRHWEALCLCDVHPRAGQPTRGCKPAVSSLGKVTVPTQSVHNARSTMEGENPWAEMNDDELLQQMQWARMAGDDAAWMSISQTRAAKNKSE